MLPVWEPGGDSQAGNPVAVWSQVYHAGPGPPASQARGWKTPYPPEPGPAHSAPPGIVQVVPEVVGRIGSPASEPWQVTGNRGGKRHVIVVPGRRQATATRTRIDCPPPCTTGKLTRGRGVYTSRAGREPGTARGGHFRGTSRRVSARVQAGLTEARRTETPERSGMPRNPDRTRPADDSLSVALPDDAAAAVESDLSFGELCELVRKLEANMCGVVLGKPDVVRMCLVALLAGEHVLLEDVPGVGKTLVGKALAKSVSGEFCRLQFTPDLLPSDIVGSSIFHVKTSEFVYNRGPIFANIVLADEINRAPPRTQSALLEAMSDRQVSVDGVTHALPRPFMVIATQNPFEFEGTYTLPESQLDRFLLRISMGYPERADERRVLSTHRLREPVEDLQPGAQLRPDSATAAEGPRGGRGRLDRRLHAGHRRADSSLRRTARGRQHARSAEPVPGGPIGGSGRWPPVRGARRREVPGHGRAGASRDPSRIRARPGSARRPKS